MVSSSGRAMETGFFRYWTSKVCRSSPMWKLQKTSPELFYKKRCFQKFRKIYRRTRLPGLTPATLLKKRLWHRCFPVNFAKSLGTPFLQNTSGRLLLKLTAKSRNMLPQDNDTRDYW